MKVTVFQARHGDCLLLEGSSGTTILADGGIASSFREHASPVLAQLPRLDLVYVSHIDEDHILGVLAMMDDLVQWKQHEFQTSQNNPPAAPPDVPKPPEFTHVWHNGFSDIVSDTTPVEDMLVLAAQSTNLAGYASASRAYRDLAVSVRQAIMLKYRLEANFINASVNAPFDGRLMLLTEPASEVPFGELRIRILGPFLEDLEKLYRAKWRKWVENNQSKIEEIREDAERDAELMGSSEGDMWRRFMLSLANELGQGTVSIPNVASLTLLVEDDGTKVLLTGDARSEELLAGLEAHELVTQDQGIHVDMLKVQHHGATANMTEEFLTHVTADHYVFCGNGRDENPELAVVEAVVDSRRGALATQSRSPGVDRNFKLWFNSSREATLENFRAHMAAVENTVEHLRQQHGAAMSVEFLRDDSSFDIAL